MQEENSFSVKYSFTSALGCLEEARYITEYNGIVCEENDEGDFVKEAGRINLKIIHLGLAVNNSYPFNDILDHDHLINEMSFEIFDYETMEYKEEVEDFAIDSMSSDICFIERMELLPEYRNQGLGKKLIKDIYNRFSEGVKLFVVKVFPLQWEGENCLGADKEWRSQMQLESLEGDEELAKFKLLAFYQNCGFNTISGISDDYVFLNPALINNELEKIELD